MNGNIAVTSATSWTYLATKYPFFDFNRFLVHGLCFLYNDNKTNSRLYTDKD